MENTSCGRTDLKYYIETGVLKHIPGASPIAHFACLPCLTHPFHLLNPTTAYVLNDGEKWSRVHQSR